MDLEYQSVSDLFHETIRRGLKRIPVRIRLAADDAVASGSKLSENVILSFSYPLTSWWYSVPLLLYYYHYRPVITGFLCSYRKFERKEKCTLQRSRNGISQYKIVSYKCKGSGLNRVADIARNNFLNSFLKWMERYIFSLKIWYTQN